MAPHHDPTFRTDSSGGLPPITLDRLFPFDGNADAPDLLGSGLKAGVTEERGIAEFPLGGLTAMCLAPADIAGATLSFNIDDVLSSFGPGTEFNGEASSSYAIHPYSGNGLVGPADFVDFGRIGAPPFVVDTTPFGIITDESLGSSGPLLFEVDVTDALIDELGSGTHLGFVFKTDDSPTGASLDNLGDMGAGPPGVNGSVMPFVTVMTGPLHLSDLRCADEETVCSWEAQTGDLSYDVVRGDLSQLAAGPATIDLGIVTCISSATANLSTVGDEDADNPLPGDAFFYTMRPRTASGPGTYGKSSDCKQRLPAVGDCP